MTDVTAEAPGRRLVIEEISVGSIDRRASGWWGMLTLILTEAFLFAYLLFSYYYFAVQYGRPWLPAELPSLHLSAPNTVVLILSSVAVWFGERGARQNSRLRLVLGLLIGLVLGAVFVANPVPGVDEQTVRPRLPFLWLAVFHHHRLSHGACRRRTPGARGAPALVGAGLFRSRADGRR